MTKVSAEKVLSDSTGIENVWKANPDMTLKGKDTPVTLADYLAAKKAVTDLEGLIAGKRSELTALLDQRDDAARFLNGLNTRARSVVRGNFGPVFVRVRSSRRHPHQRA